MAPRTLLPALLALPALLVAACAPGPGTPTGATDPLLPTGLGAAAGNEPDPIDESLVRETLLEYYELLLERDLAGACELNAPETTETLLEDARSRGLPASTCEEAMSAVYAVPGAAEVADGIARTTQVQEVTVTGDTASVTWSGESAGQRRTVTTGMRLVDGRWKVVDAQ